jgi:hypothetical protein
MDAMIFAVGAEDCGSVTETVFCKSDALLMALAESFAPGRAGAIPAKLRQVKV